MTKKNIIAIIFTFALVLSLPVGIFLSQKSQEIRPRAQVVPSETPTPTPLQTAKCMAPPQSDNFDKDSVSNNGFGFWDLWTGDGGNGTPVATVSGGVLATSLKRNQNLTVVPQEGWAGVITKGYVCGDFDVNVDFDQFTTSGQSEADARLSIEDQPGNSTVFIERYSDGNTSGFHAIKVIGGTETQFAAPVTGITSTSGKLRIRRVGSTYTLYYYAGNGWQSFLPANAFSTDAKIALTVKSWDEFPSVSANFDNFSLTSAILDPSITPIPTNTPTPTLTPVPTPLSGRDKYMIDVGDKQSLVINIGPSINPLIKFKAKLSSLRSYPDLYLRLRVKDELAFMDSQNSSSSAVSTCNEAVLPDKDFIIPVKAAGDIYSPVQQISQPIPTGATVASVTADGWVILDGMVPGRYYTMYLKGPKTRKGKMLEHFMLQPEKGTSQDFDWTGKPLDPGDLPDPNNGGKQDCTINSTDWSLEKSRIGSTDGDNLAVCDVNYDSICNAGDSVAVLDTLSKRPDDDL